MARQKTVYTTTQLIKAFLTEEERARRIPSGNLFQSGNALYVHDDSGKDYCVAVKHPKFILCDYWCGVKRRSFMWSLRNQCTRPKENNPMLQGREFIELRGVLPWSGPTVDVGEALAMSESLQFMYSLANSAKWGRWTALFQELRYVKEQEAELQARLKSLKLKGKCDVTSSIIHTVAPALGMFIITGKRQEVAR